MKRALAGAAFVALWSLPAHAGVEVSATPLLGGDAPGGSGWFSYAVKLRSDLPGVQHGTVELTDGVEGVTRAPFAIARGEPVKIELSVHDAFGKGLEVLARGESGAVLARGPVPSPRSRAPLLFDLTSTGRLETALRGERVAAAATGGAWSPSEGLELVVTRAATEPRSGEPLLPERALGYGSVTVALVRSDALVLMQEGARAALSDWVLSGGTLAVTVERPEDLRHPSVASLLGGPATVAPDAGGPPDADFRVAEEPGAAAAAPAPGVRHVPPSTEVAGALVAYRGPSLHPTRWGSAAAHGLGEVHLLAFDPNAAAFVDDAWVRRSMVDLVRVAWDREEALALAGGTLALDEGRVEPLRRLLDPNEGNRWAIGLAAALLVAYAVLAGPVSFRRAARRNSPLRALVELPIWSGAAIVLIVAIGAVAKGGRSRARRLALVECGAGERRAPVTRLRALFASSAAAIRVASLAPASLLDLAGVSRGTARALVLEHGGAVLEGLHGRPWETLLVREDGMLDLGGAVRFVTLDRDVRVENGLPRDLVAVVARAPGGQLTYFSRIPRGQAVSLASGKAVGGPTSFAPPGAMAARIPVAATPMVAHRLEAYRFSGLANADSAGAGDVWTALESATSEPTDFWPDDAPSLVAELPGGEGVGTDSGLTVESDRLFLRVVGRKEPP